MAVTRVWEKWEGRGATTDEKGVRTFKRQWGAETDTELTGEPAVIDAVVAFDATAALYAPHPFWVWAVCRKLTADPFGGPKTWLVNAEYSSAPFGAMGDGSGTSDNGTAPDVTQSNQTPADERPPSITISRKEVTKPLETDVITGARIVNNVGDPFNPVPEVFRSHHIITSKFYKLPGDLNWSTRSAFMDSINNAPVVLFGKSYPAYSLRCTDYSVDTTWETGATGMTFFAALTVVMEYDPDLWKIKILNTGRRQMTGSIGLGTAKLTAIMDDQGQPVADPVPLDAAGKPVVAGGSFTYVNADGYVPADWTNIFN
jgi:hypothetical protein